MSKVIEAKRKRRRKEILTTTFELFASLGFKAINLDTVAEHAGCSKSTIYQLFGNKEGLISALNEDIVQEMAQDLYELDQAGLSIEDSLNTFARQALDLTLSERHIAVVRTILSESPNFPNLGIAYYQHGREGAQKEFACYLEKQVERSRLQIDDFYLASAHFFGMLLWDKMMPIIVGARPAMLPAERDQHARWCVKTFLTVYRPN